MKISYGMKVKYRYKDARITIFNNSGAIELITKYCIWINNGKYLECVNLADIVAPDTAGTTVLFQNAEGKFVKGHIKSRLNPSMEDVEI